MDALFTWLSDAMTGAPWLAVLAAAGWGVASLVLSPCHLASIPLVVGFIAKRKDTTPLQAFGYALLFALGILVSIAAVGGATAAAGRMLGDVGPWANYVVAAVLLAYGIGHCTLIVVAGASTEKVQRVLNWHGNSRGAVWMRRACGLFVLAGAAWLVVTAAG
jgi:cytochrome c-type biogenesis protein